jgi:hypothetical protein
MVTSWLWVLLTDIASFKPTFLPDDNPADFSYFFDTSRRRLCYVAPERFVRAPDPHNKPAVSISCVVKKFIEIIVYGQEEQLFRPLTPNILYITR